MIMRDVSNGWFIRYLHSNTASAFFFLVYLHIGRGIYYGSYRYPRTLVWAIGTVIFILMVATAFLGYEYSPKWFNISNKGVIIKYNKVNNNRLFNQSIVKRGYCTSRPSDNIEISERLKTILQELGLKPVYVYEKLNLEETRKQILSDTRGLSGIYIIVNKVTKDYYIGSASTNRFYIRFSNHVIHFRGILWSGISRMSLKLSNSGDLLKLMVPSYVAKNLEAELII